MADETLIAAVDVLALTDKRDRKGSNWCLGKGIGRYRAEYGLLNVVSFRGRREAAQRAVDESRMASAEALGLACKACPLTCVLARR